MVNMDYSNYVYVPDELQGVQATRSLEKIAGNEEVSRASQDPALLALSENLKVNESGLTQGIENVNSALSYLQIGEDALSEQSSLLDNIKEKLLEASTDTTSDEQRVSIKNEIDKLLENIDNLASSTRYNDENILQNGPDDRSGSEEFGVQTGNNSENFVSLNSIQSNVEGLGLSELLNDSSLTPESAREYLDDIENAQDNLSEFRSDIASTSNQLESSYTTLSSQVVNTSSALSGISNVDYANEVANFSKQNILAQVGAFGQAQANNINQQSVLRLLT